VAFLLVNIYGEWVSGIGDLCFFVNGGAHLKGGSPFALPAAKREAFCRLADASPALNLLYDH